MGLTLGEANRMVQAAIAEAERINIKLSVSVCDAGGHLLAFNRMEGAIFISAVAAQGNPQVHCAPPRRFCGGSDGP